MSSRQETRWRRLNRWRIDQELPAKPSPRQALYEPGSPDKPAMPTKAQARRFCRDWWRMCSSDDTATATACVEVFAVEYPQCAHWLDDPDHWIWQVAVDADIFN